MDISAALPVFVITLREGVEATLVVGIVLAYLNQAQQSRLNPWVFSGVSGGLVASALVGLLFTLLIREVGTASQTYAPVVKPLLEAVFSLVAIALLSWMLIWMTQQARLLKAQVEGVVQATIAQESGAGWGIFGLIFFAVLREGFETVVFLAAQFQAGLVPVLGAIAGILCAIGFGILLFTLGVKINLRQFFQIMGVLLLLIVGGLVISCLGHFDLALLRLTRLQADFGGLCRYFNTSVGIPACNLGPQIWDGTHLLPDDRFPGLIIHTLFGYTDTLYLVQAVGYLLFLVTVGGAYFRSLQAPPIPTTSPAPTGQD
ncbi:hypothetical protein BST81_16200 [Leptolyngbya sp. 'hensonii']|nr:hypothetical protein BST81_16200 [Leptolyngbya sp. 'hensonii']